MHIFFERCFCSIILNSEVASWNNLQFEESPSKCIWLLHMINAHKLHLDIWPEPYLVIMIMGMIMRMMRMMGMMRIMWICDQSLDARARPNFSNNLTDHRLHPYHHQHGAVSEWVTEMVNKVIITRPKSYYVLVTYYKKPQRWRYHRPVSCLDSRHCYTLILYLRLIFLRF